MGLAAASRSTASMHHEHARQATEYKQAREARTWAAAPAEDTLSASFILCVSWVAKRLRCTQETLVDGVLGGVKQSISPKQRAGCCQGSGLVAVTQGEEQGCLALRQGRTEAGRATVLAAGNTAAGTVGS